MERNDLNYSFAVPEFRENQFTLKEKIRNLKQNNKVLQYYDLNEICTDVEKKILELDEDPTVSILHNKVRKLDTGSELYKEICLLQRHFSNLEISRAVSEVLDEEKYDKISRKIISRKQQNLKREKFYNTQAVNISRQFPGETEEKEAELGKRPLAQTISIPAEELKSPNLVPLLVPETPYSLISGKIFISDNIFVRTEDHLISEYLDKSDVETGRAVGPENVNLLDENLRVSTAAGTTVMNLPTFGDVTVPEIQARNIESGLNIDLSELEHILASEIPEVEEIPEIHEKPETPKVLNGDNTQFVDLENLPPVSDTHNKRKKRYPPVFDLSTTIPNYSKRARRLNASVNVERIQVYEGPPSILHAFTLTHALETPAVNNGHTGAVRSSVLQRLYTRHQKTEQICNKELQDDFLTKRSAVPEMPNVEEIGPRQESRSDVAKSFLLDISAIHTDMPEMRESRVTQSNTVEEHVDRLIGTPVSKILQKEIVPPPPIGASDPSLPPRLPRIRNLQGTSLEEPTNAPWFKPTEQPAPSEKWREFKYVRKCLEEIWMEKEERNLEKSATLREVLERKNDWAKENMLTLLRIVDKMSLRRELVIKGRGISVIIQPFEVPFVTEKQFSLREHAPRF